MHLLKTPCISCSNNLRKETITSSYNESINQLNKKYNNRYIYPDENEQTNITKRSKINIICPEHGEYVKSVQKHLSGQICFQCKITESIKLGNYLGGYSEKYFENNPEKKTEMGIVYYIKVGNLYKIGITTNINQRIRSIKSESKKSVNIVLVKNCNMQHAFNIEQNILKENYSYRTYRKWSTELFEIDIFEKIKNYFE